MRRAICIIGAIIFLIAVGCSVPTVQNTVVPDQNNEDEESIELAGNEYIVGASRIEAPHVVSVGKPFTVRVCCYRHRAP